MAGEATTVDLVRVADLMVLELQATEELSHIATMALVAGIDSPSLRLFAGTRAIDVRDAAEQFWSATAELGIETPTPDQARWRMVRRWAAAIVSSEISPIEGARSIWHKVFWQLGAPDDLTAFVGLASEWEDDPVHREAYEADIRDAARDLLNSG